MSYEISWTWRGTSARNMAENSLHPNLRAVYCSFLLFPACRTALWSALVHGEDLLLVYRGDRARVWNLPTGELRRSLSHATVDSLLEAGEYVQMSVLLLQRIVTSACIPDENRAVIAGLETLASLGAMYWNSH